VLRIIASQVAEVPSHAEGRCLAAVALDRNSIRFFPAFLSSTLSRQRFLHALLLARLQIEGVTLDLLNNVFLLHFAFEATKGISPTTRPLAVELLPISSPPNLGEF